MDTFQTLLLSMLLAVLLCIYFKMRENGGCFAKSSRCNMVVNETDIRTPKTAMAHTTLAKPNPPTSEVGVGATTLEVTPNGPTSRFLAGSTAASPVVLSVGAETAVSPNVATAASFSSTSTGSVARLRSTFEAKAVQSMAYPVKDNNHFTPNAGTKSQHLGPLSTVSPARAVKPASHSN